MKSLNGNVTSNQSCSCTSCLYRSGSEHSSLRRFIAQGSKIDKLYYGKYLPLRERKLLQRLVRTRAVYDDVRNQLLSDVSVIKPDLKARKREPFTGKEVNDIQRGSDINALVGLVDKGAVLQTENSSECCNCCSCDSKIRLDGLTSGEESHKHTPHKGKDITSKSSVISKHQEGKETRLQRNVRFKVKRIRSDPCTCTLKLGAMLKRPTKTVLNKLRPDRPEPVLESLNSAVEEHRPTKHKTSKIVKQSYQKIKNSKTRLLESMEETAKKSMIKVKESNTKLKENLDIAVKKSIENIKHSVQKTKEKVQIKQQAEPLKEMPIENFKEKAFTIRKDSVTKFKEKLKRKRELKDWECNLECFPEECVPDECLKKLRQRKIKGRRPLESTPYQIKYDKKVGDQSSVSHVSIQAHKAGRIRGTEKQRVKSRKIDARKKTNLVTSDISLEIKKKSRSESISPKTSEHTTRTLSSDKAVIKELRKSKNVTKNKPLKVEKTVYTPINVSKTNEFKENEVKSKNSRQTVRIGSTFSFNVEFYKEKPPLENSQIKLSKTTKIPVDKMKYKAKAKDGHHQARKIRHRQHKTLTNMRQNSSTKSVQAAAHPLKRCFCTLKLKSKKTSSVNESIQTKKMPLSPHILLPYECEPMVCVPGECDPAECLKRIRIKKAKYHSVPTNTIDRKKSTSNGTSKSSITSKIIAGSIEKPIKYEQSTALPVTVVENKKPQRQAVRIGSTFSFDIEFSKGSPNIVHTEKKIMDSAYALKQRKRQASNSKRNKGVDNAPRHIRHKQSMVSNSTVKSKYTVTKDNLRRCFCTSKLGNTEKRKSKAKMSTKGTLTTGHEYLYNDLKKNVVKSVSVSTEKNFKIRKPVQYNLLPYECEPGICVPGECNPFQCKEIINKRNIKIRKPVPYKLLPHECEPGICVPGKCNPLQCKEIINKRNIQIRYPVQYKLLPYECEPGICVPGECNPYQCKELINKREAKRLKSRTIKTNTKNKKSKSTSSFTARSSTPTKTKKVHSALVTYKKEVPSQQSKSITLTQRPKLISNTGPTRQAVKIGSTFSFNIEFFKEKPIVNGPVLNLHRPPKAVQNQNYLSLKERRSQGINNPKQKSTLIQAGKKHKSISIGPAMKKCFCTLKFQKDGKNNKNKAGFSTATNTLASENIIRKIETISVATKTKDNMMYLKSYECEPNICIPGECDPYKCLEIIKRRSLRHLSKEMGIVTDLSKMKSSSSSTQKNSQMLKNAYIQSNIGKQKRFKKNSTQIKHTSEPKYSNISADIYSRKHSRQAIRLGSTFSFDIQVYKDRPYGKKLTIDNGQNEHGDIKTGISLKHTGEQHINQSISHHKSQVVKVKTNHKATGVKPILKRCFCTLKLQKKYRKKELKAVKPPKVYTVSRMTEAETKIATRWPLVSNSMESRIRLEDFRIGSKSSRPLYFTPKCFSNSYFSNISSMTTLQFDTKEIRSYFCEKNHLSHTKSTNKTLSNVTLCQSTQIKSNFPFKINKSTDKQNLYLKERGTLNTSLLQTNPLFSHSCHKLNENSCADYTKLLVTKLNKEATEVIGVTPFLSRCFCTMNIQIPNRDKTKTTIVSSGSKTKKKRLPKIKLEAYECEPGVCVPDECDPVVCKELIMKRLMKTASRMSGTNEYLKSSSSATSHTTTSTKAKKMQSRVAILPPVKLNKQSLQVGNEKSVVSHKQAVRVGSNFSFNVEFFKDTKRTNQIQQPVRISNRKNRKSSVNKKLIAKSTGGKGINSYNKQSQSDEKTIEHKASAATPLLKRCFCTLKLQKKGKANQTFDIENIKKRSNVENIQTVDSSQNTKPPKSYKLSNDLSPFECEPQICIPGECNPYECFELIKKRKQKNRTKEFGVNSMKSRQKSISSMTNTEKLRMKRNQAKFAERRHRSQVTKSRQTFERKIHSKNSLSAVESSKQAIRIGSNFSFNIEFSKGNSSVPRYENTDSKRKTVFQGVRQSNSCRQKEKYSQNMKKHHNKNSQAGFIQHVKSTMTNSFIKRCFCTKSLRKGENFKLPLQSKPVQLNSSESNSGQLKSVQLDSAPKPDTSLLYQLKKSQSFFKQCVCVLKYFHARNNIKRKIDTNDNGKFAQTDSIITTKQQTKLEPYECEPNVCVPGQCNPFECMKRIKKRHMNRDSGTLTTQSQTKSRSSVANRSHKSKNMNVQYIPKLKQSGDNDGLTKFKRVKQPSLDLKVEPNRQAVRIGSSFSFDIDFFKEKSYDGISKVPMLPKSKIKPTKSSALKSTEASSLYSKNKKSQQSKILRHRDTQILAKRVKSTMTEVTPFLRRCFCTLKLQKPDNKLSTATVKKTNTQFSQIKIDYQLDPTISTSEKATRTSKKYYTPRHNLEPFECEPGVCIPGQCDTYECAKRINRRKNRKHSKSSNTERLKEISKTVSTYTSAKAKKSQAKSFIQNQGHKQLSTNKSRDYKYNDIPDRQAMRIGSNFSFDIEFYKEKSFPNPRNVKDSFNIPNFIDKTCNDTNCKKKKNSDKSINYDTVSYNRFSQATGPRMESTGSGVSPLLKRCFCTLKLQKLGKQERILRKVDSKTKMKKNILLHTQNESKNEVATKKHASTSGQKTKGTFTNSAANTGSNSKNTPASKKSKKEAHRDINTSEKISYDFEPFECEPNICTPGLCNPHECYERIKHRYTRNLGTETVRPSKISKLTSKGDDVKSIMTQNRKLKVADTKSNTRQRRNKYKTESCRDSNTENVNSENFNRQVVRLGSSFSFDLEFYKNQPSLDNGDKTRDKQSNINKIRLKSEFPKPKKSKSQATGDKYIHYSKDTQVPFIKRSSKASGVAPLLKRCFCTLTLQKSSAFPKKANDEVRPSQVSSKSKTTSTKAKYISRVLEPYECEPGTCIPGKCDPYDCEKRIKKRNRTIGTHKRCSYASQSTMTAKSTISTKTKKMQLNTPLRQSVIVEQPRFQFLSDLKNKQAVRIGSNFSFNVEFYKEHIPSNLLVKSKHDDGSNYPNKKKSRYQKCDAINTNNCDSQTRVTIENKASIVGNVLKRCFCVSQFPQISNCRQVQKQRRKTHLAPSQYCVYYQLQQSKTVNKKCECCSDVQHSKDTKTTATKIDKKYIKTKHLNQPTTNSTNQPEPSIKKRSAIDSEKTKTNEMETILPYTPGKFKKKVSKSSLLRNSNKKPIIVHENKCSTCCKCNKRFCQKLQDTIQNKRGIKTLQSTKNLTAKKGKKSIIKEKNNNISSPFNIKSVISRCKCIFSKHKSKFDESVTTQPNEPLYMSKKQKEMKEVPRCDVLKLSKSERRHKDSNKSNPKKSKSLKIKVSEKGMYQCFQCEGKNKFSKFQSGDTNQQQFTPAIMKVHKPGIVSEEYKKFICKHCQLQCNEPRNKYNQENKKVVQFSENLTNCYNKTSTKSNPTFADLIGKCFCSSNKKVENASQVFKHQDSMLINEDDKGKGDASSKTFNKHKATKESCPFSCIDKYNRLKDTDKNIAKKKIRHMKHINESRKIKKSQLTKPCVCFKGQPATKFSGVFKQTYGAKIEIKAKGPKRYSVFQGDSSEKVLKRDKHQRKDKKINKNQMEYIDNKGGKLGKRSSKPDDKTGKGINKETCECHIRHIKKGMTCACEKESTGDMIKSKIKSLLIPQHEKICACHSSNCECAKVYAITKRTQKKMKKIIKLRQKLLKQKMQREKHSKRRDVKSYMKNKEKVAKRKRKEFDIRQRKYHKEDELRKRKRIASDKYLEERLKSIKNTRDLLLAADSLYDIAKLGCTVAEDVTRSTCRAIVDPYHTYQRVRMTLKQPKQIWPIIKTTIQESGAISTLKRVARRIQGMQRVKDFKNKLYENEFTNYLMKINEKDPRKRMKRMPKKKQKRKREPMDFQCSLYMSSLRKKPYLIVYYTCPWFYPHFITLLQAFKQFTDMLLFIAAVAVWSPCILCMELCRAMMCCFLCTG